MNFEKDKLGSQQNYHDLFEGLCLLNKAMEKIYRSMDEKYELEREFKNEN